MTPPDRTPDQLGDSPGEVHAPDSPAVLRPFKRAINDFPVGAPCWADLLVTDVPKAQEFYSELLGWTWRPGDESTGGYAVATLDDHPMAGVSHRPESAPIANQWVTYLRTTGAQGLGAAVVDLGGKALTKPTRLGRLGRSIVATDPNGAVFGGWEAGSMPGFGLIGPPGTPVWNELLSRDYERIQDFQARLFRHTFTEMGEPGEARWSTAQTRDGNPAYGLSEIGEEFAGAVAPHWITAFRPHDLVSGIGITLQHGGDVLYGPYDGPFGLGAVLRGPQGEVFSLLLPDEH